MGFTEGGGNLVGAVVEHAAVHVVVVALVGENGAVAGVRVAARLWLRDVQLANALVAGANLQLFALVYGCGWVARERDERENLVAHSHVLIQGRNRVVCCVCVRFVSVLCHRCSSCDTSCFSIWTGRDAPCLFAACFQRVRPALSLLHV